jgi:hypothetical protein
MHIAYDGKLHAKEADVVVRLFAQPSGEGRVWTGIGRISMDIKSMALKHQIQPNEGSHTQDYWNHIGANPRKRKIDPTNCSKHLISRF